MKISEITRQDYNIEELLAVVISREVRNDEITTVGSLSPIPAAGVHLAKATRAPRAKVMVLGGEIAPFTGGEKEGYDLAQRGKFGLFFLSFAQIDRQANINLTVIGSYDRPRVRLPGGAGSGTLYYMAKRVILFRTDHTPRIFVEKVDFKTSPGVVAPTVYRPGGPYKVLTPLCVFAFDRQQQGLVLESVHPGVTVAEVVVNTGFPLEIAAPPPFTAVPTAEELHILRTEVRGKLAVVYPQFAERAIRSS